MRKLFRPRSLTRLEAGINANRQVIEANRQAIGQLGKEFSKELDKKLFAFRSELLGFMKWGFGLLLIGMFILFGFILWDRQSTFKPIKNEMDALEKKKVNCLIATLKKLSEHDMKIADAMRSTGLL